MYVSDVKSAFVHFVIWIVIRKELCVALNGVAVLWPVLTRGEEKHQDLSFYCFPGRQYELERKGAWIKAVNRM